MKTVNKDRSFRLLNLGACYVRDFGKNFTQYNLQFLGKSITDDYIINGESTKNAKATNEFCYGYDNDGVLLIVEIFKTEKGVKFGAIELSMSVYGYWQIIE